MICSLVSSLVSFIGITEAMVVPRDVASVPGFNYGTEKIRGVNLGGWFILEPYMNPSFFDRDWSDNSIPVDEFHYTQKLGKEEAFKTLNDHWSTWIQESDFEKMASWGINFVRIPIGYWAVLERPQDPYVQGQIQYLDSALEWARKNNIKAWVDLHGVPGSQNGFDNSGLRDSYAWQNDQNMTDTYTALSRLSERYGGPNYYDVVAGIELVNEPLGSILNMDELHDYYNKGYGIVRDQGENGVIAHDAFKSIGYMNSWLDTPDYYNVVLDHHFYQVFSVSQLNRTIDEHIQAACDLGTQMGTIENKWRVVGEWSAALTDCAPLVNGVYKGSRWDGSFENTTPLGTCKGIGNIADWSDEYKTNVRKYAEAQMDAYEHGSTGWIIWAYKTEDAIEWDLSKLIDFGLFPNPVTSRQYSNQCNY